MWLDWLGWLVLFKFFFQFAFVRTRHLVDLFAIFVKMKCGHRFHLATVWEQKMPNEKKWKQDFWSKWQQNRSKIDVKIVFCFKLKKNIYYPSAISSESSTSTFTKCISSCSSASLPKTKLFLKLFRAIVSRK